MCFTISVEKKVKEAIKDYLTSNEGVQMEFDFDDDFYLVSGFSHPKLPIIKQASITLSEWGLIPSFAFNSDFANEMQAKTLNARSDKIHETRSYKKPIISQRCILVVDGFFESQDVNGKKFPHYIYPADGNVFYLGCIYNLWTNKETGEVRDTFSIITTDANILMSRIHNLKKRMPLILHHEDIADWINPETSIEKINRLMVPFNDNEMAAHSISKNANKSWEMRNYPEIKDEVKYPELIENTKRFHQLFGMLL